MPLQPEALLRQVLVEDLDISPDGRSVVYSRRTAERNRHVHHLWIVPYAGGRPRCLTSGASSDTGPQFSPGGSAVAFLSDRHEQHDQLFLLPLDGGEARRLTDLPRGLKGFSWAPDGRSIVVLAEDAAVAAVVDAGKGESPVCRVIRRIDWRNDEAGGLVLHPAHLHRVHLRRDGSPGRVERLTGGDFSVLEAVEANDGRLLFLADRGEDRDLSPRASIWSIRNHGDEPVPEPGPVGECSGIALDGDELVSIGLTTQRPVDADPTVIHRNEVPVTADEDRFFGFLARDGRHAVLYDDGRDIPVRVDRDGAVRRLVDASFQPSIWGLAASGGRVVASMARGAEPPDIYALEEGTAPRRLTRDGRWLAPRFVPVVTEISVPGPGGRIQAFVFSPPDADGPCATILEPHGGPTWHSTAEPPFGAYGLVSRGYRVVCPNFRGSWSHGRAWIQALSGDWGGADAADCHAVLDWMIAEGLSDPDRLGVTGLSYGGFLTNWLIATSDRFRAAVSENGVANQVSDWASSDCGADYCRRAGLGDVTEAGGVESLWRQSPLRLVTDIKTPLLLLQGEADLRCPASDAEQLFVALRWLRREVEYVVYPESFHEYRTYGRPDRRVDRHRRQLEWFLKHMPPSTLQG